MRMSSMPHSQQVYFFSAPAARSVVATAIVGITDHCVESLRALDRPPSQFKRNGYSPRKLGHLRSGRLVKVAISHLLAEVEKAR